MDHDWKQFLAKHGLAADDGSLDVTANELGHASTGNVIAPLVSLGVIRVSGPDASEFLHNLLTNDIKGLKEGTMRAAGLCNAKGRLLALFLVWRDGEDLLLACPSDVIPAALKKLTMYKLRSKVALTDTSRELALFGVSLQDANKLPRVIDGLPSVARFETRKFQEIHAIGLGASRWLLAISSDQVSDCWPALAEALRPVDEAAWRWLEIRDGLPQVVAATQEAYIPQMLNLELAAVGGVSFSKGCYPGQEIVARTQYLGKVKRRMFRARTDRSSNPGTPVFSNETGDQHCGSLVSVAPAPGGGFECLVCVQIGAKQSGDVRVGAPDGAKLEFLHMPYPVTDDDNVPA